MLWLSKHLATMLLKKYFNMRNLIQAIAELLVLDEPVRPDAPTDLTIQTGLTGPV